jgi:hypothetical protein
VLVHLGTTTAAALSRGLHRRTPRGQLPSAGAFLRSHLVSSSTEPTTGHICGTMWS